MINNLVRIGIFYDGSYFANVSNYYTYVHPVRSRLDIGGIHEYVRNYIAKQERVPDHLCQIVSAHYFRGRYPTKSTDADKVISERLFEDVLINAGVTTHFLSMGLYGEKGIDVWFALEAYGQAMQNKFDVCVIIAGDSDFVPLVRSLNALGIRVMLIGWDFSYEDRYGEIAETYTSNILLKEATYPLRLSDNILAKPIESQPAEIQSIFLQKRPEGVSLQGTIHSLKPESKYGFILGPDNRTIWFSSYDLSSGTFDMLEPGLPVTYVESSNSRGRCAKSVEPVRIEE